MRLLVQPDDGVGPLLEAIENAPRQAAAAAMGAGKVSEAVRKLMSNKSIS